MAAERASGAVLEQILTARRRSLEQARARVSLEKVQQAAERRHERRGFAAALSAPQTNGVPWVIAEIEHASPSAGLIREDYRCREIAQDYEAAGAVALSVLTEEQFFQGSLTDLIDARDAVSLPVLRKDFILDAYQVYESVAAGADALLLIVAALADAQLATLLQLADQLQIAALVEVHTEEELSRALAAGAQVIGVNNRDLKTLQVSLDTSFRLRERIPSDRMAVSESGIRSASDLRELGRARFNAVLIGEQLLKAENPGSALAALLEAAASQVTGT